jgi:hypothetical protein
MCFACVLMLCLNVFSDILQIKESSRICLLYVTVCHVVVIVCCCKSSQAAFSAPPLSVIPCGGNAEADVSTIAAATWWLLLLLLLLQADTVTALQAIIAEGEADHMPVHLRAYRIAKLNERFK